MHIDTTSMRNVVYILLIYIAIISLATLKTGKAWGADLEFVFPKDGATFLSNDQITIILATPTGRQFTKIGVYFQQKFVYEGTATAPPYEFPVYLPYTVGPVTIYAKGRDQNGQWLTQQVTVNLAPRPLPPGVVLQEFKVVRTNLLFHYVSESRPLSVKATLSDGRHLDFTHAVVGTMYEVEGGSSNVITVSPNGVVTARGNGQATVLVKNNGLTARVNVVVNITNNAPQLAPLQDTMIAVGKTTDIPVLATDPDRNSIELGGVNLPAFARVIDNGNGSGILRLTPQASDGGTSSKISITALDDGKPPLADLKTITVQILGDTTPPTTTATASPSPNTNGWNNTKVTVTLTAVDNSGGTGVKDISFTLSGAETGGSVVAGSSAAVMIATEGSTTLTYFARDNAGNAEASKSLTIQIDQTPPTLTCSVNPTTLWPPNHKIVPVTVSVTATDARSGAAGFTLLSATSNEPDNGLGDGDVPNDIQGFVIGTPSTSGQLRAERSGNGKGRIYTLSYKGMDKAGNAASCHTTVTVPHDQGKN